jgi:membrane glycosyltransferase
MPHQLFPLWPSWNPQDALALFGAVASMLFVPKLLAALIAGARARRPSVVRLRLALSVLCEIVVSALLAPMRMLFHTQFVLAALAGWAIRCGWGLVAWQAPQFLPWIAPVAAGLLLAVPLSVLMSRTSPGSAPRRAGLFLTPDETAPTLEVTATEQYAGMARPQPRFADAVLDPELFLVVRTGGAPRSRWPVRFPPAARSSVHCCPVRTR